MVHMLQVLLGALGMVSSRGTGIQGPQTLEWVIKRLKYGGLIYAFHGNISYMLKDNREV